MKPRRDAEEIVKIELTIKENQETSPELCITYRNSASNRRKINRETRKNTAIQSQPQFLNSLACTKVPVKQRYWIRRRDGIKQSARVARKEFEKLLEHT